MQINSPAAVYQSSIDRVQAFVVGSDGNLYLNLWNGSQWVWEAQGAPPGTKVALSPAAVYQSSIDRVQAFVVGSDGNLYLNLWNGSQWVWEAQGTPFVPVSSAAFKFSPGNWKGDTGRGGTSYRQSWNQGAWFEFVWMASASPTATILLPNSSASNKISYFLNGVLTDDVAANGSLTLSGIAASATNTLRVYLRDSAQSSRWNNGANVVQVQGVQLDSASSARTASAAKPWALIVGDSITEGIEANAGSDNHLYDYSFLSARHWNRRGTTIAFQRVDFRATFAPATTVATYPHITPFPEGSIATHTADGTRSTKECRF
jgi:hypothetical protein